MACGPGIARFMDGILLQTFEIARDSAQECCLKYRDPRVTVLPLSAFAAFAAFAAFRALFLAWKPQRGICFAVRCPIAWGMYPMPN